MSDTVRTIDDYVSRYANDYCGGDIVDAKNNAIVKSVISEKKKEDVK